MQSEKYRGFFYRLLHRVLYFVAAIIVLMAVVFTITRAMTPVLTSHKAKVEGWMSRALNLPVTVEKVSFGWRGIEPEMWLKGVSLYNRQTHDKIVMIHDVYVSLDFFRTLYSRELRLGEMTFSGFSLQVKQTDQGYRLNDALMVQLAPDHQSSLSEFIQRILMRALVNIRDAEVNYTDKGQQHYFASIKRLSLHGGGHDYQIFGELGLAKKSSDTPVDVNFIIENRGQLFDYTHAGGRAYFSVNHVDLRQWFSGMNVQGYWPSQGDFSSRVWLTFQAGQVTRVSLTPTLYHLKLHSQVTGDWLNLKSLTGRFAWAQNSQGWQLSGHSVNVISEQSVWPPLDFYVAKDNANHQLNLAFNRLNLQDITHWLAGSTLLPKQVLRFLREHQVTGVLSHLVAFVDTVSATQYQLQTTLENVALTGLGPVNQLSGVSGALIALPSQGRFKFNTPRLTLGLSHYFDHPLQLSAASGDVSWSRNSAGLKIIAPNFSLANADLAAQGSFAMDLPIKGEPFLSLLSGLYLRSPTAIPDYLPKKIMKKGLADWLDHAFLGGAPVLGKLMIHGKLSDFPYTNQKGTFSASMGLQDLDLHFADGWPDLKHIQGIATFADNGLQVKVGAANLIGASLENLTASIPALAGSSTDKLLVSSTVHDCAGDLLRFFRTSALKNTLGKATAEMEMQGDTISTLHLDMPLDNPDETQVSGNTQLLGVNLLLPAWRISLSDLRGTIAFTNTDLSAAGVKGRLLGQPLFLTMKTLKKPYAATQVSMQSSAQLKDIFSHFNLQQPTFLNGRFGFTADLTLPDTGVAQKNTLVVKSDLQGVSMALPPPFAKSEHDKLPSRFETAFSGTEPATIQASLGHTIAGAAAFVPDAAAVKLYSANLNLGGEQAVIPVKPIILVSGKLPVFSWAEWQPLFQQTTKDEVSSSMQTRLASYQPEVEVQVDRLIFPSLQLDNAAVHLHRYGGGWQLGLTNALLDGYVDYPDNFPNSPLNIYFNYLHIPSFSHDQKKTRLPALSFAKLPWVDIQGKSLQYQQLRFDTFELALKPAEDHVDIRRLALSSYLLSANFSGDISLNKDKTAKVTHIRGEVDSQDLIQLLNLLDYHSSLLAKTLKLSVDVNWPGLFSTFQLENLTGDANLLMKDGWLLDLGQSATQKLNLGKLLTLLSVKHLLTLHVQDFGRDGYHFDTLTASLNFLQGKITSDNIEAFGQVADLKAKGWINLLNKTLDLRLGVDTNLGASLPIIATIAGGPVVGPIAGFATWALGKIIHDASRKSASYDYHITGPWSKVKVVHLTPSAPA